MDFSRCMSHPWECQWLGCNLGSRHTQGSSCWKVGAETLYRIGVSWFCENDPGISEKQEVLLDWAQVYWNEALLGWFIHRLLWEIRQTHCQGSLLPWGFPHLWWFECYSRALAWWWGCWLLLGHEFSDQKFHLVPKKMFQTKLVCIFLPKALVSTNWHFLLKNNFVRKWPSNSGFTPSDLSSLICLMKSGFQ